MARPGRRLTPTRLAVIQGKWDARTMFPEPAADPGPCPPPQDLDGDTREVWEQYRPELEAKGLLAPRYVEMFRVLCQSIVINRRLGREVMRTGAVLHEGGRAVVNPAWRAYRQSAELLIRLAGEYGLTPNAVTAIARDAGRARQQEDGNDPRRLLR